MAGVEKARGMGEVGEPRTLRVRDAVVADVRAIARLHADSWRRHYRGAYADSYLDEEADEDRSAVWNGRFRTARPDTTVTLVAEHGDSIVGFVHAILDGHPHFGAEVDNLHVVAGEQRSGVGSRLLGRIARVVTERRPHHDMYLWVLEQNAPARAFYRAMGGVVAEKVVAEPPGGRAERLVGTPQRLRIAWADPAALAARMEHLSSSKS